MKGPSALLRTGMSNPVFEEGGRMHTSRGRGFVPYASCLMILAGVELLALVLPSLSSGVWLGAAYLFRVSSIAGFMLVVYFAVRMGNREFGPDGFQSFYGWFQKGGGGIKTVGLAQVLILANNVIILVLICFPPLVWAGDRKSVV